MHITLDIIRHAILSNLDCFECSQRPVVMASVKSFHGKQTQHRFLFDAVSQIKDDDPESADVVLTQIIPLSTKEDLG